MSALTDHARVRAVESLLADWLESEGFYIDHSDGDRFIAPQVDEDGDPVGTPVRLAALARHLVERWPA